MAAPEHEYQFSSDEARIAYARDKVEQYADMVNAVPKPFQALSTTEVEMLTKYCAPFYLANELNSVGTIYRGDERKEAA